MTMLASGAVAVIGFPPTIRLLPKTLCALRSKAALNENSTSADVKAVPSDQRTPWRRCIVWVLPSAVDSQRSASHGSTSNAARWIRTRRPCVNALKRSDAWSAATSLLNERGVDRTEPTIWPPQRAVTVLAGEPSGLDGEPRTRKHAARRP